MKQFVNLLDFEIGQIERLVALAKELQDARGLDHLRNRVVGLLFMNPSLRTLASMQAAIAHLGGSSFVIQPGQGSWKLELRDGEVMDGDAVEHVREAIPVLGEFCDILGVRAFAANQDLATDLADQEIRKYADLAGRPFVNLESAATHPCQALADWKTLDDLEIPRAGGRFVLSWAYHPKPLPYAVPAAALTMAALRGMDVTVLRPPGYDLPAEVRGWAEDACARSGGTLSETSNRAAAMDGAHVLYCKSWARADLYGRPDEEQAARQAYRDWTIDEAWFAPARADAKFMHCLPVRRNVKVRDEILDGPRSVVIQQAANRLHAQKAILAELSKEIH